MARASGLTIESVTAAVEAIKARSERVSLRSVRAELGEGSLTTIQRLLGEIGEDKPRAEAKPARGAAALPDRISQAINDEIAIAVQQARIELQETIDRLQTDLDASLKEIERLNEALEREKAFANDVAQREAVAVNANGKLEYEVTVVKALLAAEQKEREQEREKRHKAELAATEQAGLAQRMQDVAIELRQRIEQMDAKPKASPRTKANTPSAPK